MQTPGLISEIAHTLPLVLGTFAIALILSTPLLIRLVRILRTSKAKQLRMWNEVARRSGGALEAGKRRAYMSNSVQVVTTLHGINVRAYTHVYAGHRTSSVHTRVECPILAPKAFRISVGLVKLIGRLEDAFGLEDVQTGDYSFDKHFLVKSSMPELVPLWIDADVRALLAQTTNYSYSLSSGQLVAERDGFETEPDVLLQVMKAASMLAGRGQHIVQQLHEFAKRSRATEAPLTDPHDPRGWQARVPWQNRTISIQMWSAARGPLSLEGRWSTTVTCAPPRNATDRTVLLPNERVRIWRATDLKAGDLHQLAWPRTTERLAQSFTLFGSGQGPSVLWSRELADKIQAMRGWLVHLEVNPNGVQCILPGVQVDPAVLTYAMDIVGMLASERDQGPYRA